MHEPQDRPAANDAAEASAPPSPHPWLDTLAKPFLVESAEPEDDSAPSTPRRCGVQIDAWWTRLI